jgi:hypothetical protein
MSVLLDWSVTGDGAVAEDVTNLIVDSFTDGLMDVAVLPELADRATDGYISGLRDGGWSGSADSVRTAIAGCGAAKYRRRTGGRRFQRGRSGGRRRDTGDLAVVRSPSAAQLAVDRRFNRAPL